MRANRLACAFLSALLLSGCTHASDQPAASALSSQPAGLGGGGGEQSSAVTVQPTSPGPALTTPSDVAEVDGSCPYISSQDFADAEGDRVGRVTILQTKPIGCRFYFQYDASVIVGEIHVETFTSSRDAYNAMVRSATGHPEVQSEHIGDDAVAFKTDLQGTATWQCVFAKNTSVVTVRTRQGYPALNAFNLARKIAPAIT